MCGICDSQDYDKITCCGNVTNIPTFLNNVKILDLTHLKKLDCSKSKVQFIPKELVKLE